MEREFSAGGVVVRRMRERWWIAAIEPQISKTRRVKSAAARVLALPKGLVDPGEGPEQAALREVREETGLEAQLLAKLSDIRYVYVRSWGDQKKVFKVVSFYLLLYRSGRLGEISPAMRREVRSAEWLPLEEAAQRLSYHGERQVASRAQQFVAEHPDLLALKPAAGAASEAES
jgi:8-oxo-dGTP pyrophosphatase MutT (NUDIX family)